MSTFRPARKLILYLCCVLFALFFLWDLYTPLGVADGAMYGIPVLLTLWVTDRRLTLLVAACASLLVIVGGYVSPHGDAVTWSALSNRAMALPVVWIATLLVLQRKTVESELRRSESNLAEAQRIAQLGYWHRNIADGESFWSEEVYRMFGVDPNTFPTNFQSFLSCLHPDDRAGLQAAVNAAIAQDTPYTFVYRVIRPDGSERTLFARGAASYDKHGKPLRILGTVQDITERRRLEQALQAAHDTLENTVAERTAQLRLANNLLKEEIAQREQTEAALTGSQLQLRTVIGSAPIIVYMLDAQGIIQLIDGRELASLGLQAGQLVGQSVFVAYAQEPQVLAAVRYTLAGENVTAIIPLQDNWFDVRLTPLYDAQGAVTGAIGVATNITALKLAEDSRLGALQAQRDTLVREVHHRIKNNLQGVTGLLRQQSMTHPALRPILEQAIAQVRSVAIVHGLHSERPSADIMLGDMLQAISRSLNELSHALVPLRLDVAVVNPIQVAKDEAVPIALIMNELMTNALKHNLNGGVADPVVVRVQGDCEAARISISNTGALPPDFSLPERRGVGTGLNLVLALLPHSGATLAISQENGAVTARVLLTPPVICNAEADAVS